MILNGEIFEQKSQSSQSPPATLCVAPARSRVRDSVAGGLREGNIVFPPEAVKKTSSSWALRLLFKLFILGSGDAGLGEEEL